MVQWVKFWVLALIWGSSFLLIKVGVDDLGAFGLVTMRLGVAAVLYTVYLVFTKRHLPRWSEGLGALIFISIFNMAVPFVLVSWAETKIDTGLATVLNATVPLFNLMIAHFAISDERLTLGKILGLLTGFVGVLILVSRTLSSGDNAFWGQLASLTAALCYAVSIVVIRTRLRHLDSITIAGGSVVMSAIMMASFTALFVRPLPAFAEIETKALLAVLTLGIVNTVGAYFLFYGLLEQWGVRATLVLYATPPIGVALGYLFLDETIDWRLVVGGTIILAGILVAKTNVASLERTLFGFYRLQKRQWARLTRLL